MNDFVPDGRGPTTDLDRTALDGQALRRIIADGYDSRWTRDYRHSPFTSESSNSYECPATLLGTSDAFPTGYREYSEVHDATGPNNAGISQFMVRYASATAARQRYRAITAAAARCDSLDSVHVDRMPASWRFYSNTLQQPIGPFHTSYAIITVGDLVCASTARTPSRDDVITITTRLCGA
ncbi:sensor domain-containing protein [Gordonia sp. CPCC 205333]|uniref:sensor domain-containing protein n=1 Tax=Gordonia sp. CPCC 205333 TaxID=3140790 RepID=UPI003AF3713F